MKWLKHYTNASEDDSLNVAMDKFGVVGYSYFWFLVELCADKYEGDGNFTFRLHLRTVAARLRTKTARTRAVVAAFSELSIFTSKEVDNVFEILWPKLSKYVHRDAISSSQRPASDRPLAVQKRSKRSKRVKKKQENKEENTLLSFFNSCFELYKNTVHDTRGCKPTLSRREAQSRYSVQIKTQQDLDNFEKAIKNYGEMLKSFPWRAAKTSFQTFIGANNKPYWTQWLDWEPSEQQESQPEPDMEGYYEPEAG